MAKKRNCRRTSEEIAIHEEAVKLRKMTDEQLVMAFRASHRGTTEKNIEKNAYGVKTLIDGLSRGDCKGIKGATVYKITEYAKEMGVL